MSAARKPFCNDCASDPLTRPWTAMATPPIAVVVPMVALFSLLRLSDTYFGMVLAYTAFTLPFSLWMIRSFIEDVPEEVRKTLEFHPVETLNEVLKIALVPAEPGEQAPPLEMKEVA